VLYSWDYFFWIIWGVAFILVVAFGLVIFIGAPYMPTLKKSGQQALELLDLKPGQTLIDLGSGDGAMLKLAAEAGLNAVGYELNPFLVLISKVRTLRYGRQVRVHWGNFWQADVSKVDGIFVFLHDIYMERLDQKLKKELPKGTPLASHAFKIPGKKSLKKTGAVYLYKY